MLEGQASQNLVLQPIDVPVIAPVRAPEVGHAVFVQRDDVAVGLGAGQGGVELSPAGHAIVAGQVRAAGAEAEECAGVARVLRQAHAGQLEFTEQGQACFVLQHLVGDLVVVDIRGQVGQRLRVGPVGCGARAAPDATDEAGVLHGDAADDQGVWACSAQAAHLIRVRFEDRDEPRLPAQQQVQVVCDAAKDVGPDGRSAAKGDAMQVGHGVGVAAPSVVHGVGVDAQAEVEVGAEAEAAVTAASQPVAGGDFVAGADVEAREMCVEGLSPAVVEQDESSEAAAIGGSGGIVAGRSDFAAGDGQHRLAHGQAKVDAVVAAHGDAMAADVAKGARAVAELLDDGEVAAEREIPEQTCAVLVRCGWRWRVSVSIGGAMLLCYVLTIRHWGRIRPAAELGAEPGPRAEQAVISGLPARSAPGPCTVKGCGFAAETFGVIAGCVWTLHFVQGDSLRCWKRFGRRLGRSTGQPAFGKILALRQPFLPPQNAIDALYPL